MRLCRDSVCLWPCYFLALFVVIIGCTKNGIALRQGTPSKDFSTHRIISPTIYHGRLKRQITSTLGDDGLHTHEITIGYNVDGQDLILDLRLNRELLPSNFFVKYQHSGKHVVNRPTGKDVELCQYIGSIRGVKDSWVALSTCKGLEGVVFDGKNMHYLHNSEGGTLDSPHYLYKHEHLIVNHTCGYESGKQKHNETGKHEIVNNEGSHEAGNFLLGKNHQEFNRILRYKRSDPEEKPHLRGPYNANKQSRYVELVLVADNKEYKEYGENINDVYQRCKNIANIINALYSPLNIYIALVGVIVWTEQDEIALSDNGDTTLTNFLHYRRKRLVKEHPNDNAQLLTRQQFTGGVVGKALKGPICTYEFSGGVNMDHSAVVGLVATTIAHEMGHNFGMEHDTEDCKCPDDRCIMSPSSSSVSPSHWSSCSLEFLALAFQHGMDYCLRNKPTQLFDSPVCGNGFVEAGEQCDCGLAGVIGSHATGECSACCNVQTCMLRKNATCATGECCDLNTCRPHNPGMMCRSADHECDLPEFCTGESEFCPDNIFKMDTEPCDHGRAFCYQGSCRTRSDQCRLLWGPSGETSDDQCYEMNKKGSRVGNCGYMRLNQSFMSCEGEDVFCGMLHCRHLNERLEFGMESVAILSHSFINNRGSIIACRSAMVDLGLNQIDPGLVPDGAKCGDGKMCVNQKCMAVSSLRLASKMNAEMVCPSDCSGHGVCNTLGHCHCDKGFAPPLCETPGPGGSQDSGPASNPNVHRDVMTAMYIIFLGIIPGLLLLAFLTYYSRHNVLIWWKKPTMTNKSLTKNSLQRRFSRGANVFTSNFRGGSNAGNSPSSPAAANIATANVINSPDDMSSSLLKSDSETGGQPQNHFFGNFKGFSLMPIDKQTPTEEFGVLNKNFGIENESRGTNKTNAAAMKYDASAHKILNKTASVNKPNTVRNMVDSMNADKSPKLFGINLQSNSSPLKGNMNGINIHNQSPSKGPVRSAPPPPVIKSPAVARSYTQAPLEKPALPVIRSNTAIQSRPKSVANAVSVTNSVSSVPALPPQNPGSTSRPLISSPILEASTCSAKELKSPLKNTSGSFPSIVPMRPAPSAPEAKSLAENKRPMSIPNTSVNTVTFMVSPDDPLPKKPKEATALNRIASFLKQDKGEKEKLRSSVERSNSLPRNPNHQVKAVKSIDKSALRNLQISNPILQKDIELPSSAVPVVSDSDDLDDISKMMVSRAQSMRGPILTQKPNIPAFGSMRQPPGFKRPTSIPAGSRPTSPPPPRPDEKKETYCASKTISGLSGFEKPPVKHCPGNVPNKPPEYDDCIAEKQAPLANITEESSITEDNIYAVIEESLPVKRIIGKNPSSNGTASEGTDPSSLPSEYKTPKRITPNNGSADSMSLLGEIVTEIQSRNFDSIYSTSTLARKKKEKEEREAAKLVGSKESNQKTYMNASEYKEPENEYSNFEGGKSASSAASTTSSGYLDPSVVNVPVGKGPPQSSIVGVHNSKAFPISEKNDSAAVSSFKADLITPFTSTFQSRPGPFLARYAKDNPKLTDTKNNTGNEENGKSGPTSPPSPTAKNASKLPTLSKQITPPNLKTSSALKTIPIKNNSKFLEKTLSFQMNSPDLVSSCSVSDGVKPLKSPDVINMNVSNRTAKANVNEGVILKPAISMPPKPINSTSKMNVGASRTLNKPPSPRFGASADDGKLTLKPAPAPPVDKKKVPPARPGPPKIAQQGALNSNCNPNLGSKSSSIDKSLPADRKAGSVPGIQKSDPSLKVAVAGKGAKQSNVASLQKRFETPRIPPKVQSAPGKK